MGRGVSCSYRKTTLLVSLINILIALFVLRSLYASLYLYSDQNSSKGVEYSPDQIRRMEESVRIRRSAEPVELVRLVKRLEKEMAFEVSVGVELPESLKMKLTNEVLEKMRLLPREANVSEQRVFAERWCDEKLEETKELVNELRTSNSTISLEEAEILVKALESDRMQLLEDIGFWIPSEFVTVEHDDKPEGELGDELDEVLPGPPLPPECHAELHTDYAGAAVRWGLNHHKESAADCCQACLVQAKHAKPNEKKCNVWVYCPAENGCHSPDIYDHRLGECWLKFAETPKLNFKDTYPDSYRRSHPSAPVIVPWASGIVSVA